MGVDQRNHLFAPVRRLLTPPALRAGSSRPFQALDSYWRSTKSGYLFKTIGKDGSLPLCGLVADPGMFCIGTAPRRGLHRETLLTSAQVLA